jgi:pimeloyl-ACP methyl ester carboxylesterase
MAPLNRPSLMTLLRWLGPWAGPRAPLSATRAVRFIDPARTFRGYLYTPAGRPPAGAYLIAPGLHHLGPDDARLDRFCRVLAASGLIIFAPFLPDYCGLRVRPTVTGDLARAWDHLEALLRGRDLPRPSIFSISFGSAPAIELAAEPSYRERVGALVLFGGFADFEVAVRFAITGRTGAEDNSPSEARDPLNSPAVFMNLLPHLEVPGDKRALEKAWFLMVERTWGRMHLKAPGARDPYAHQIARTLPAELRALFLIGCGLRQGGAELLEEGLRRAGEAFQFADPRPHLSRVRAPVFIVHGRDDDVIPWLEADKIRRALPEGHPHELHITGFYGHTGAVVPRPMEVVREAATLLSVARLLVAAPAGPAGARPMRVVRDDSRSR